jgi:hypothetical protein
MLKTNCITKKLSENNAQVVIAQDINADGAKQYIGLGNYDEIFDYVEKQEQKCFHEVMPGLQNRRLYFDFDLKAGEGDFPEMADFVHAMKDFIVLSGNALEQRSTQTISYSQSPTERTNSQATYTFRVSIPRLVI